MVCTVVEFVKGRRVDIVIESQSFTRRTKILNVISKLRAIG
jgi:hypothetical protein